MTFKIFALEDLENIDEDNVSLDEDVLYVNTSLESVSDKNEAIKVCLEVKKLLNKMSSAESYKDSTDIAVNYLVNSVGYSKDISLEDFNKDSTELINIALEGSLKQALGAIPRLFKSKKSLFAEYNKVKALIEAKGTVDKTIDNPIWGKYLTVIHKKPITAKDLLKFYSEFSKDLSNVDIKNIISKTEDLVKAVDDLKVILDTEDTDKAKKEYLKVVSLMRDTLDYLKKINEETNKILNTYSPIFDNRVDKSPTFKTPTNDEAKKILSLIEVKQDNNSNKAINEIMKLSDKIHGNVSGSIILSLSLITQLYNLYTYRKELTKDAYASTITSLSLIYTLVLFYQSVKSIMTSLDKKLSNKLNVDTNEFHSLIDDMFMNVIEITESNKQLSKLAFNIQYSYIKYLKSSIDK